MKRVKIALAVLAVALVGAIAWQIAQSRAPDPVYKSRKLSEWLKDMWRNENGITVSHGTVEAVRELGTNAIPTLLQMLRTEDSPLELKLRRLIKRQQVIKVQFTPIRQKQMAAAFAFDFLGTNAQSAVPALIQIVDDEGISPSSRELAILSLGYIGPPAKQSVPHLLPWATNGVEKLRDTAQTALRRIDPKAANNAGITNDLSP